MLADKTPYEIEIAYRKATAFLSEMKRLGKIDENRYEKALAHIKRTLKPMSVLFVS